MFRKRFNFATGFLALIGLFAAVGFAQENSLTGKVMIKSDAGNTAVNGATVSCYYLADFTESKNTPCATVTTDGEGKFTFAGLQAGAKVILAVSGNGIQPNITLPVGTNEKDQNIYAKSGEGKPLTKIEVWNGFAFSGDSSDQKKAKEAYEKYAADATTQNEKIKEKNDLIEKALKEGNTAFSAKNYDLAITKYQEGIDVDPNFVGSAPVLLNNKGTALKIRATENYNAAVKSKDPAAVSSAKANATKDLSDALGAFGRSYEILSKAPAAEIINAEAHKKNTANALEGGVDAVRIMTVLQNADPEKTDVAKNVTTAYLNSAAADKANKGKAQANLAKYLMYAYDYERAIIEFKKALEYSPKDPDILAFLGLSLYSTENQAHKQQSLNYLDVYMKTAPKDHALRGDMSGLYDDLTKNQKLKPQKIN